MQEVPINYLIVLALLLWTLNIKETSLAGSNGFHMFAQSIKVYRYSFYTFHARYEESGSRAIAPEENLPTPNIKTNPKPNPNPNRGGSIYLGANCLVAPNPKSNPPLDPNPNPNRGAIFLGGQLPGYQRVQLLEKCDSSNRQKIKSCSFQQVLRQTLSSFLF